MSKWIETIKTVAPTVATALGGPLAGAVVTAIGAAFGISEPTQEKIRAAIEDGQMTGAQVAELRALELKLKAEEQERGFRYAELEFKDRDSARQREAAVGGRINRNLAYFVVASFVAVVGCTLAGWTQVDSVLAGTLIGYLSAKAEQVMAYYFGSTSGSQRKTELLAGR